jgi:hypothetical protein
LRHSRRRPRAAAAPPAPAGPPAYRELPAPNRPRFPIRGSPAAPSPAPRPSQDFLGGDGAAFATSLPGGMSAAAGRGAHAHALPAHALGPVGADARAPFSASELNAPEFSTDEFRMYAFKVQRCAKRFVHDWRSCPFAHPTENARRRDPRAARYLPVPCPDYKRGICLRGDGCPYAHGVYECWLHPARYRTQLCKEGPRCRRPVCFFAHAVAHLRAPAAAGVAWDGALLAAGIGADCAGNGGAGGGAPGAGQGCGQGNGGHNSRGGMGGMGMNGFGSGSGSGSGGGSGSGSGDDAPAGGEGAGAGCSAGSSLGSRSASGALSARAHSSEEALNNMAGSSFAGAGAGADAEAANNGGGFGYSPPRSPAPGAGGPGTPARAAADALTHQTSAPPPPLGAADEAAAAAAARRGASFDLPGRVAPPPPAGLAGHAPGRASLDSLLAAQHAAHAEAHLRRCGAGGPGWGAALAASAALQGVPVNEQPLSGAAGPRMSNAVARKLGLAPARPPHHAARHGAGAAPLAGGAGGAPPLDGLLRAAFASGGGGAPPPYGAPPGAFGAPLGGLPPLAPADAAAGRPDALGLDPALLTAIAANLAAASAVAAGDGGPGGQAPLPGLGDASAVARLVGSLQQWGLSPDAGAGAAGGGYGAPPADGLLGAGGGPFFLPPDLDGGGMHGGASY